MRPDDGEEDDLQGSFKTFQKPKKELLVDLEETDAERDIRLMKESVLANKKQLEMI